MNRRRFLQITAAAACLPAGARAERLTRRRVAFGAETELTLYGPRELAEPALAEAEALIDRVDALFSLHRPFSALSKLNREGVLEDPPPEMVEILTLSGQLHRATGGSFDPTVQPLWRALAEGRATGPARRLVGFDRIRIAPDRVALDTGQALTLNGIAQGYATDLVADALARHGLDRALVEIGEHRALGGPWRLGLEDPAHGILGQVTISGRAIATSSPGAVTLAGGETHILNPLADNAPLWSTVSVEADSAALADGLSTAFCLLPADRISTTCAGLAGEQRVRLVSADGSLTTV